MNCFQCSNFVYRVVAFNVYFSLGLGLGIGAGLNYLYENPLDSKRKRETLKSVII